MPRLFTRRRILGATAAAAAVPLAHRQAGAADPSGPVITLRAPFRAYDSRSHVFPADGTKLAAGQAIAVTVAGGFEPFALAVFINLTVTATEGAGYLLVVPSDLTGEAPLPPTSNVNWSTANQTLANVALVAVGGENAISVRCFGTPAAKTHFIVDVQGWVPSG